MSECVVYGSYSVGIEPRTLTLKIQWSRCKFCKQSTSYGYPLNGVCYTSPTRPPQPKSEPYVGFIDKMFRISFDGQLASFTESM